MSKIMVPQYVDDLTGERLGENGTTIAFAFQGHSYEIDLSPENAEKMTNALGQYIDHARRATSSGRRRSSGGMSSRPKLDREESNAIRAWARKNGWPKMGDRGRIPTEAIEAFNAKSGRQIEMPTVPEEKPKAEATGGTSSAASAPKPAANGSPKASDGNSPKAAKPAAKATATPASAS